MSAYVLQVQGRDSETLYHYGVFASRCDALAFGNNECSGYQTKVIELITVERFSSTYVLDKLHEDEKTPI